MPNVIETVVVDSYSGEGIKVMAGQTLRITDVEGKQVGDFICYNADDLTEHVSPVHMRASLSSIRLKIGDFLFSNRREHMMQFTADTVGKHDFLFPACDYYRYKVDFGVEDHPNCKANLYRGLSRFDMKPEQLPDPINWFMNNDFDDLGDYTIREPLSKPGDYVELKAIKNCICALTTCSQDYIPVNGMKVTVLKMEVFDSE